MVDKLERKYSIVEQIAKQPEAPLALLQVPKDALEREKIGEQLWTASLMLFESRLSEREKKVWGNPPLDEKLSLDEMRRRYPENMRLLNSFHDFILHQLGEHGAMLLLNRGFIEQIVNWQKHGQTDLCNRVGAELALWSNVWTGDKSAPIPEDADVWADHVIAELERLLRRVRDEFGPRTVAPTCERIAAFALHEVEDESRNYRLLRLERAHLCGWIETLPARNRDAAAELLRGELTANDFFYLWYSNSLNRDPKAVRNQISDLGARRASG